MKKLSILILGLMISIVFGVGGYLIGVNSKTSSNVVGIYHSYSWNHGEATLVLNADGTCKYPTGDMVNWTKENKIIHIHFGNENKPAIHLNATKDMTHYNDATIVKDGLILHDILFQKMSN